MASILVKKRGKKSRDTAPPRRLTLRRVTDVGNIFAETNFLEKPVKPVVQGPRWLCCRKKIEVKNLVTLPL